MTDEHIFPKILEHLINFIQLMNLEVTGPIGEIVAQLLLLKAFKNSQKITDSEACTVESFLTSLFGHLPINCNRMPKKILNGLVYFNHFIRRLDDFTYDDVIPRFIARGAAGQFMKNFVIFDLFIPVVLEQDEVTYILIQVKNRENITAEDFGSIFNKMRTYKELYKLFKNKKKGEYISLIMSLGEDFQSSKPNLKSLDLFFNLYDLSNCMIYDQYTLKRLQLLLNCDRFDVKSSIYDQDVIDLVTIGSLKH